MILFSLEIYKLINCALSELTASQTSGRTPNNPLSEAHYLGAWVTTAMKQKRFDSLALNTLKKWQRQARSLGKNAGLKEQFMQLEKCYSQVLNADKQVKPVNIDQLNKLYAALIEQHWVVTTDLIIGERLNRHSDGKHSLIVCAQQIENCFDQQGRLIKPLSLYIRGDLKNITDLAFKQDLLLYKEEGSKSKVKYHGKFIIYPDNDGTTLPELPIDESKEKQK